MARAIEGRRVVGSNTQFGRLTFWADTSICHSVENLFMLGVLSARGYCFWSGDIFCLFLIR
jgi:hypothetical protein